MRIRPTSLVGMVLLVVMTCRCTTDPDARSGARAPVDDELTIDARFAEEARAIAKNYESWGRVDGLARWVPTLCRIPPAPVARMSAANATTPHGGKLYSVFAKRRDSYPDGPTEHQVVVKEAWRAELVTDPSFQFQPEPRGNFYPYAMDGDIAYHAAERAGLFIMFMTDPSRANTDAGWVYATIDAHGDVTAAGRIASCMKCHQDAEHGRLFGLPAAQTQASR